MKELTEGTLTVAQLMQQLSKFDPNLPVRVEGCDCIGDAKTASAYLKKSEDDANLEIPVYVLIERFE